MTQPSGCYDYGVCGAIRHDKVKKELLHKDFLLDLCLHEEAQDMEECEKTLWPSWSQARCFSSTMRRLRYGQLVPLEKLSTIIEIELRDKGHGKYRQV